MLRHYFRPFLTGRPLARVATIAVTSMLALPGDGEPRALELPPFGSWPTSDCAMLLTAEARAGLVFPFGEKAFWVAGFIAACAMAAAMLAVGFVVDLSNGHRSLLILPIGGLVLWVYLYGRLRRRD